MPTRRTSSTKHKTPKKPTPRAASARTTPESKGALDGAPINLSAVDLRAIEKMDLGNSDAVFDKLNDLDAPADVKSQCQTVWEKTMELGGKAIAIGKKVMATIFWAVEQFPMTTTIAVIAAAVAALAHSVPVLGLILGPLSTALAAVAVAAVLVMDIWNMLAKKLGLR